MLEGKRWKRLSQISKAQKHNTPLKVGSKKRKEILGIEEDQARGEKKHHVLIETYEIQRSVNQKISAEAGSHPCWEP